MAAERSAIAAWVASWDAGTRRGALAGVAEKARALRGLFGDVVDGVGERDLLAGAVFLEYAEHAGVCPLELHWLLGDVAQASMDAVMGVRAQMMIEDAARGDRRDVDPERMPRAEGLGRPWRGDGDGRHREDQRARPGEEPGRGTRDRSSKHTL